MQPYGHTPARAGGIGVRVGVLLALALLSGCSTVGSMFGSAPPVAASAPASSSSPSMADKFNNLLLGMPTATGTNAAGSNASAGGGSPADIDCPGVQIRQGASTFSQSDGDNGSTALSLRYQANFVRFARTCVVRGGNVLMKVGVEGRLILGPAGGPGTFTLPVRLAVVREGIEPKMIWTKFYEVAVTVSGSEENVPFTNVEEDMSFPMPPGDEIDAYVIYVGFDPESAPAPKAKPARPKAKAKAKAKAAQSAQ